MHPQAGAWRRLTAGKRSSSSRPGTGCPGRIRGGRHSSTGSDTAAEDLAGTGCGFAAGRPRKLPCELKLPDTSSGRGWMSVHEVPRRATARRKWHAVVEMLRVVARLVRRIGGAGRLNAQLGCVLEDLACRCDAGQGRRTKRVSSQACCIERPLRGSYSEVPDKEACGLHHCCSGAPQRGCARWARRCEAAQENDHGHPAASRRSRWIAGLGSWVANRLSKAKSPPIRVPDLFTRTRAMTTLSGIRHARLLSCD